MSTGFQAGEGLMSAINTISGQFELAIYNLIKGNIKRAKRIADNAMKDSSSYGMNICMQNVIEELANEQALKSGIVNSPSVFPGIGTIISFLLLGTENFLILEQGVKLATSLLIMNGFKPGTGDFEERIIIIIGQTYGIIDEKADADTHKITKDYLTKILPPQYISKGFNKIVSRIFPTRNRILKLLPVFGILYAALEGYTMTVKVGQITVKYIKKL